MSEQKMREALERAREELHACQSVLWALERDGIDPEYGAGARKAIEHINECLLDQSQAPQGLTDREIKDCLHGNPLVFARAVIAAHEAKRGVK